MKVLDHVTKNLHCNNTNKYSEQIYYTVIVIDHHDCWFWLWL